MRAARKMPRRVKVKAKKTAPKISQKTSATAAGPQNIEHVKYFFRVWAAWFLKWKHCTPEQMQEIVPMTPKEYAKAERLRKMIYKNVLKGIQNWQKGMQRGLKNWQKGMLRGLHNTIKGLEHGMPAIKHFQIQLTRKDFSKTAYNTLKKYDTLKMLPHNKVAAILKEAQKVLTAVTKAKKRRGQPPLPFNVEKIKEVLAKQKLKKINKQLQELFAIAQKNTITTLEALPREKIIALIEEIKELILSVINLTAAECERQITEWKFSTDFFKKLLPKEQDKAQKLLAILQDLWQVANEQITVKKKKRKKKSRARRRR